MPNRPIKIKAVLLRYESIRNQPALEAIMEYLRSTNVKIGLLCDKDKESVHEELNKNESIHASDINTTFTTDKLQDPADENNAIVPAAQTWKLDPRRILLLSDRQSDLQLGGRYRSSNCFLGYPQGQTANPGIL